MKPNRQEQMTGIEKKVNPSNKALPFPKTKEGESQREK